MNRLLVVLLVLLISLASFTTNAPAEDVLDVIPQDTLGFVVVPDIASMDSKISEVAKLMKLPAPSVLMLAKLSAGVKAGLDNNGSMAVALVENDDADMPVAPLFFLPTSDYPALIKSFEPEDATARIAKITIGGAPGFAAKKGNYAIFAPPTSEDELKAALDSPKNVAKSVESLGDFIDDGDITLVATPGGVKLAATKVLDGIEVMKMLLAGAGEEAKTAVAGMAMYEKMFEYVKEHVTHFGLSLSVEMNGTCHLASRTLFDSQMQDPATPPANHERSSLASLPDAPFVAAFHGDFPGGLSESFMKMSAEMMKAYPGGEGLTDEHIKKIVKLSMQSMSGVKSMSFLLGVGDKDAPLYSNMLLALTVDDAAEYLKKYEEVLNGMRAIGEAAKMPIYQFEKPKRIEHEGNSVLELVMDISAFSGLKDPAFKDIMAKMFGADGKMRFYLSKADTHQVVGAYVSPKSLKRAFEAVKNPKTSLAANEDVAKTTAMLLEDPQWVVYISPGGSIQFTNRMISTLLPPELGIAVPEFPESPPIGFAGKSSQSKVDTDLVVPASVLKAIGEYVEKVNAP